MTPPLVFPGLQALWLHESQSPSSLGEARQFSLHRGQIDHQFHYSSPYQTQLWQRVHEAHSPIVNRREIAELYESFSKTVADRFSETSSLHVIGLGTGGGRKDRVLLEALRSMGKSTRFTPIDVSPGLALLSAQSCQKQCDFPICPVVADLLKFPGLPLWLDQLDGGTVDRLYTFYGLLPNFIPDEILPLLHSWIRPRDRVAFNANLVPGELIAAGMQKVRSQYDNLETSRWLQRVLRDWGLEDETQDYFMAQHIQDQGSGRFEASVRWRTTLTGIHRLRLFFSNRFTLEGIRDLIHSYGFEVENATERIDSTCEEGLWLLRASDEAAGDLLIPN